MDAIELEVTVSKGNAYTYFEVGRIGDVGLDGGLYQIEPFERDGRWWLRLTRSWEDVVPEGVPIVQLRSRFVAGDSIALPSSAVPQVQV